MARARFLRLSSHIMQGNTPLNFLPVTDSIGSPLQFQPHPPRRILVVDQDPYICHLNADVLIRHGFEVNAVEDGAAGWEELQANPYHLLITELDLPKITGVKLVRKLRDARLDLPVVMVARRLPTRELARNPSLQLAATLLKPLATETLLATVKIVLRTTVSPGGVMPIHASVVSRMIQHIHAHYGDHTDWGLNE